MDECNIATFFKVIFEVLPRFAPRHGSGPSPYPALARKGRGVCGEGGGGARQALDCVHSRGRIVGISTAATATSINLIVVARV